MQKISSLFLNNKLFCSIKILVDKYIFSIGVTFFILFFLIIGTNSLSKPGLYYDEVLFVNAALGGINNDFVFKRIFDIPVMVMPYIGALKSYIYSPIFYVFGVSPETIRLPTLFISTLTLITSFSLGKTIFNKWMGLLLVALMATDPTFIYASKLDFGPVVLMHFFKILALLSFFKIVKYQKIYFAWLLTSSLILGLLDKLNFIWFVSALFICSILFYGQKILKLFKSYKNKLIYPFLLLFILITLIIIFLIIPVVNLDNSSSEIIWNERFIQVLTNYIATMNGRSLYEFVFAKPYINISNINFIFVVVSIASTLFVFFKTIINTYPNSKSSHLNIEQNISISTLYLFWLCLFFIIYFQLLITKQAGGPHHFMMLFPLPHLIIISGCFYIFTSLQMHKRLIMIWLLISAILLSSLLGTQIKAVSSYAQALQEEQFNPLWSPSIYELSNYLNKNINSLDFIISVDWGIQNQIFSLSQAKERIKYLDLWPTFKDMDTSNMLQQEELYKKFFFKKKVLIVAHSPETEVMQGAKDNFLTFAGNFTQNIKLVNQISDQNNSLYEIYLISD